MFSHRANSAASAGCFELRVIAVDEPPQKPATSSPSDHCGSGAIAHLPFVSGATPSSTAGPQTALGQASSVPSLSCLFHCGVYIGWSSIAPSVTRPLQYLATCWLASSAMPTDQDSPSTAHHSAPACCESPANQPGSLAEKVVR